ncbi:hypothetical protein DPMN_091899 [Dreissena polymorpha]|uniref:BEN domain-containing protein n=1 Tax=Dreissena polymorpha TaxID=45954 RepID=A0A9D4QZI3_DREPO|nr:hypothetical protein DPMN_091899 [Dreissena polymorpha]
MALMQEIASLKDLMSPIVMAMYNQTATSAAQLTAAQPTVAQPTHAQPIYVQPTYTPCPESEAIAYYALLSDSEVRMIRQASHGPGNFTARLTKRLYPELFTAANVRLYFNYHSGGRDKKQALSPRRKSAIRRFVVRHFPKMSDKHNWGHEGVAKINKLLHRPARAPAAILGDFDE